VFFPGDRRTLINLFFIIIMYILDGVERGLRISIDNSVDTVKVTNTEAEPCVPENLYSSLFVSIFLFRTDRNFHTHQLILFI